MAKLFRAETISTEAFASTPAISHMLAAQCSVSI